MHLATLMAAYISFSVILTFITLMPVIALSSHLSFTSFSTLYGMTLAVNTFTRQYLRSPPFSHLQTSQSLQLSPTWSSYLDLSLSGIFNTHLRYRQQSLVVTPAIMGRFAEKPTVEAKTKKIPDDSETETTTESRDKIKDWDDEDLSELEKVYRVVRKVYGDEQKEANVDIPKLVGHAKPIVLTWSTSMVPKDRTTWPPAGSVLSDLVVYLIIEADVPTRKRNECWSQDFDMNGNILKRRLNRGPAANWQVGRDDNAPIYDVVYRGYYLLHGDLGASGTNFKDSHLVGDEDPSPDKKWAYDTVVTSFYPLTTGRVVEVSSGTGGPGTGETGEDDDDDPDLKALKTTKNPEGTPVAGGDDTAGGEDDEDLKALAQGKKALDPDDESVVDYNARMLGIAYVGAEIVEHAFKKLSSYATGAQNLDAKSALSLVAEFSTQMANDVSSFPRTMLDTAKKGYPQLADDIDTRVEAQYPELGDSFYKKLSMKKNWLEEANGERAKRQGSGSVANKGKEVVKDVKKEPEAKKPIVPAKRESTPSSTSGRTKRVKPLYGAAKAAHERKLGKRSQ